MSRTHIGRPNDRGILVTPEPELYEQARKAHLAGWQIGTHANGDAAIDITLRVYERLNREAPRRDPRFRLEHGTVLNDALIGRIRALGAIVNPFSTYVYYHGEKMREYGPERLNSMFRLFLYNLREALFSQAIEHLIDLLPRHRCPRRQFQRFETRMPQQHHIGSRFIGIQAHLLEPPPQLLKVEVRNFFSHRHPNTRLLVEPQTSGCGQARLSD